VHHNTGVDRLGTTFALFGICMPNFLLALLLIFLFGVTLRWLPISGYVDPLEEGWAGVRSLVLPAVTLGLALAAVVTRTLRSSLLDALAEDYVRTARAKGLAESHVIRRHVLKNALIPVVTVLGLQLGTLIGGAVITERSEEHTSELQSRFEFVCRLLLERKKVECICVICIRCRTASTYY